MHIIWQAKISKQIPGAREMKSNVKYKMTKFKGSDYLSTLGENYGDFLQRN